MMDVFWERYINCCLRSFGADSCKRMVRRYGSLLERNMNVRWLNKARILHKKSALIETRVDGDGVRCVIRPSRVTTRMTFNDDLCHVLAQLWTKEDAARETHLELVVDASDMTDAHVQRILRHFAPQSLLYDFREHMESLPRRVSSVVVVEPSDTRMWKPILSCALEHLPHQLRKRTHVNKERMDDHLRC